MGDYSKNLGTRVLTRGPKEGYCAICSSYGRLTKDHVPPKGCGNIKDVVLKTFTVEVIEKSKNPISHSQGGSHFRTICGKCNNDLLGIKYDPELIKFYNEVTNIAKSAQSNRISIPRYNSHFIKPQKIARAVVGHLLAANSVSLVSDVPKNPPFYDALSSYFLDENSNIPEKLDIYFWLYPFRETRIIRGIGKKSIMREGNVFGDIIKFMPFGFWLVWDQPRNISIPLQQLVPRKDYGHNELHQVVIDYGNIPHQNYPETPTDDEIVLYADKMTSVAE